MKEKALEVLKGHKCCVCQDQYGYKFVLAMINGEPCSYLEDEDEWWPATNWTVEDDYRFWKYNL